MMILADAVGKNDLSSALKNKGESLHLVFLLLLYLRPIKTNKKIHWNRSLECVCGILSLLFTIEIFKAGESRGGLTRA